jgi:hypothetical protein
VDGSAQSDTPSSTVNASTGSISSAPQTTGRIQRISEYLLELDQCGLDFQETLKMLSKCAETQAILSHKLKRELEDCRAIASARIARTDISRRQTPCSGIIHSKHLKPMRRKASKNPAEVRRKGKWTKVLLPSRRHGRLRKK